jgi:hypothetical protein
MFRFASQIGATPEAMRHEHQSGLRRNWPALCGFIKYTDVFDLNLLPLFYGFWSSLDIQQMQHGCGGGEFHRFLIVGHCQFCGLK